MKTLKKLALIAVLVIMTSGAFAQQRFVFGFTDQNYIPGDTYTITAQLFYNGNLYTTLYTNAPVYLNSVNPFKFKVPYDVDDDLYFVRVYLAKNGYQSIWWFWDSNPFNTNDWFTSNIVITGAI
jgi:hypothetical protein